tara:strand:+ start:2325 stop:2888 length:564 start_codon:yes stop_codon:yes gene_type:complete
MMMYHTAALGTYQPSTMVLSGNLIVTGAVSASVFQYKSIQIIDATGSTSFGNTNDDTHTRVGSLIVKKSGGSGAKVLSASMATEAVHVRGLNVIYEPVTVTSYTASTPSYILGVRNASNVRIQIPSASIYGSGALLIVKDEAPTRAGTNIILTGSGGYTFDNTPSYTLTGSMPAISLYSNGVNWFVF